MYGNIFDKTKFCGVGLLKKLARRRKIANEGPYLRHNVFSFDSMNPPKADFGQGARKGTTEATVRSTKV
jgi:hypothetical protein